MAERASPNCDARPAGTVVDMLVMHYTGMESANDALARLTDPEAKVSAHYLVDEDGSVVRLVPEELRAWHAGVSSWRGWTDVNARSIGIELVNPGHEWGYRPFPAAQILSTTALARDIVDRWSIPPRNVVGHSDVAPRRKMDPGELFDWRMLAAEGVGLWPQESDACSLEPDSARDLLSQIGYETEDLFRSLTAFQRHFRPARCNGRLDFETARLLRGLADLCA